MRIHRLKEPAEIKGTISQPSTRRLRVGMGTWIAIEARAARPSGKAGMAAAIALDIEQGAIEAAYAAINRVEQSMHPHRRGSDLARINAASPYIPIEIQTDTWRVLQLARRLHEITNGVFDPCLPSRSGSLQDVELGSGPMLVCHAPVEIDLGGIAKGYAIDQAIEALREHGCCAGLVNVGGDLRVFGDREAPVLLRQADASFRQLALKNSALAVSDLDTTDRPAEHQGYYSRKRQPTVRQHAAVIAKDAATADGLTKCVLLCAPEQTARALREFEATLA